MPRKPAKAKRKPKPKHPFPLAVFSPGNPGGVMDAEGVAIDMANTAEDAASRENESYELVAEYHLHKVWRVKRGTTFEELKP